MKVVQLLVGWISNNKTIVLLKIYRHVMLNLFNLKERLKTTKKSLNPTINRKTSKHFPSPLREWNNSIYVYNKNTINVIPYLTNVVNKIVKTYFNLYNKNIELKMRTKRLLLRFKRLSSNKIFVSNGLYKHTNNKVYINLYIFNRQKINYLLRLKKSFMKILLSKSLKADSSINLIKRIKLINKKGLDNLIVFHKHKNLIVKTLNTIRNSKIYDISVFKDMTRYTEDFYKNLIKKSLKKMRMYFYYKQLVYLNKSKLNYTYLQYLKKSLVNIYNKNVEFNIINLKRFYLNSDILSESIRLKLTRNRRKIVKFLNKLRNKINIRKKKVFLGYKDTLTKNTYIKTNLSSTALKDYIVSNLKYRHVTGFRIEAKGRLNKRFTASRSLYKLKYKGNLLEIDSSYRGLSSVILKGNLRSNTQYTKLKSKSRIGSFGIKGWVSGN